MRRGEPEYARRTHPILLADQMIAWMKRAKGHSVGEISRVLGRPRYQIRDILYGLPDMKAEGPPVHHRGKHST